MPNLNQLEYHIVSDGVSWVDGGGAFGLVPRVVWEKLLPPNDKNFVPFALNSLLIRSDGKTILVDTGYGRNLSEKFIQRVGLVRTHGDLLDNLQKLDVAPEDVDIVINTHLHVDHCGGNTYREDGLVRPTFPNAQYFVQRREYADAIVPNERTRATYFRDNFQPLYEKGQLTLLNGDTSITGNVRTAVTRGHTRAHQVVILESGEKTALFVADMVTLHYHFQRMAWITGFDVEPLESIETKRYWRQWALERDALIIFQHDTQTPVGRLSSDGAKITVEPVAIQR